MDLDFSNDTLEKLLLKRVLTDKNWIHILSQTFDKRWFKIENVGLIAKLAINFYKKYDSIPTNSVLLALVSRFIEKNPNSSIKVSDVSALLSEISQMNFVIDDNVLQANLKEFVRRNAFYNALFDNATILERSPNNYAEVVDKCLESFDKVQKIVFNDTDLGLNYFNESDMIEHWKYIKNPESKLSTGWEGLDYYTNGGFLKLGKMLAIFMGQAGLGKSLFLSNLAVNLLKQNLKVVVISLEMSQDVYGQRFDAHISNCDINHLNSDSDIAISRIKTFYNQHPNANLYIKEYPPRSIKTTDIELYLDNLKSAGYSFDAIIIDYLNLVLPERSYDNMYKDGLAVAEKLRALSYKYSVPVITAVQANSDGMNNENIGMENCAESRGIVHTTDFMAGLFQTDEMRENGLIGMRLIKNRLGIPGKVLNFQLNPQTLVLTDKTLGTEDVETMAPDTMDIIKSVETTDFDAL